MSFGGDMAMNASESLGSLGWAAIGLLALAAAVAVAFGFAQVFYFAIVLAPLVLVLLVMLCSDPAQSGT